ncbi:MAG: hypothetical protein A3B68_06320 [Candidatus Melainabacteria bacterium RIFCSPHIGHO2_02_FULL_34_12]|nr:MAG: hypothetical protein A3B68_06320 [Candidatus Melainabacteria bacterium RIFCSPHIGHO2_02_FULL_34_12]
MKYALKEWNTTIEALGKGQVIAIWRKGGIEDKPNVKTPFESFNVEQNQFVFSPTFTHENPDKIKSNYWLLSDQNKGPNKDNQIKIKYWAEIEEVISVEKLENLINISSELVNTDEYLISSWNLYPSHQGKILILRVYSLGDPVLITYSPEHAGCKSWIELNIDIPKAGSKPVFSFKDFSKKIRLIKALLEQPIREEEMKVSAAVIS